VIPETRFASIGNDRIAYHVWGEGPRDVLYTSGLWSHLDVDWEDPSLARFNRRLGSFCRVIRFDRRGAGLSDRPTDDGTSFAEHWLQDCKAVLDAVGSSSAVFFGSATAECGPLLLRLLERDPSRCSGLIFFNSSACWARRLDYPQGHSPEAREQIREFIGRMWGKPEFSALTVPSRAKDEKFLQWYAKFQRSMASPRTVMENIDALSELDARDVLPNVRVPTLVMGRAHARFIPIAQARYLADHIPGARFVEVPGSESSPCWETPELIADLVEEFVTGKRHGGDAERTIATVMFTDIVASTERAASIGNAAWRALLDRHDQIVREQVALYRGRFVDASGDGTLATFDNPGRAIDCAQSLQHALKSLDLEIRAGIHAGEIELRDDGRIGGMAVHIGARVLALAGAGQVFVSHTVQGMLVGSHYRFEEYGTHELKGVPGHWPLYAVTASRSGAD
jgi:class 3 adenylate cyclase